MTARSVLLDSTPLSAAASEDKRMQAWLVAAQRQDARLYVSAATLTEVFTGEARDAKLHRFLLAVSVIEVTRDIGIRAGSLRHAASNSRRKVRDLTLDAIVVATAEAIPGPVLALTGDPGDLNLLLNGHRDPRADVVVAGL